jgi:hypothetical protein
VPDPEAVVEDAVGRQQIHRTIVGKISAGAGGFAAVAPQPGLVRQKAAMRVQRLVHRSLILSGFFRSRSSAELGPRPLDLGGRKEEL